MSEKRNIASAAFGFLSEDFRRYAHTVELAVCNEDFMTEYRFFAFSGKIIKIVTVSRNHIYGYFDTASDIFFPAFDVTAMDQACGIRMHFKYFMQVFVISVSITHYKCFIQSNNSVLIFLSALPL